MVDDPVKLKDRSCNALEELEVMEKLRSCTFVVWVELEALLEGATPKYELYAVCVVGSDSSWIVLEIELGENSGRLGLEPSTGGKLGAWLMSGG